MLCSRFDWRQFGIYGRLNFFFLYSPLYFVGKFLSKTFQPLYKKEYWFFLQKLNLFFIFFITISTKSVFLACFMFLSSFVKNSLILNMINQHFIVNLITKTYVSQSKRLIQLYLFIDALHQGSTLHLKLCHNQNQTQAS